jgi:hypothetical protein
MAGLYAYNSMKYATDRIKPLLLWQKKATD